MSLNVSTQAKEMNRYFCQYLVGTILSKRPVDSLLQNDRKLLRQYVYSEFYYYFTKHSFLVASLHVDQVMPVSYALTDD